MYKALYRKYRPLTFDDVYGQETIVKTLKNSIINRSYSHAYMFFGPRGTGKTSISKIFARSLNCLNPIDGNACGVCNNCINSHSKECIDIIEIDAASNNGVDEIRELRNKISLVPSSLKYKVYIIDEVHMLSIGAFNALLKTLEEPPEHVVFILATTDPQKVPETIISRCQCFSFKRISTDNLIDNLKSICAQECIEIDDDVLLEISYASNGGMRDALSLLDQLRSYCNSHITLKEFADVNGSLTNDEIYNLYKNIFSAEYANVLSSINKYNQDGKNIIFIFEKLMRIMRDEIIKYYTEGKKLDNDIDLINKFILLINEKMFDIKRSANPVIYIEMLLLDFMYNLNNEFKEVKIDDYSSKNDSIAENESIKSVIDTEKPLYSNKNSEFEHEKKFPQEISENMVLPKNDQKILELDTESKILIDNIDDIMTVRVNNTLAKANKQMLINEMSYIDMFNDYTFDQDIGFIACSILDSKIRAVSDDSIIISFEYDSTVKQNLEIINKFNEVYNRVTNSNKKIAIISDNEWERIKSKYISDLKAGIKLEVVNEPEEIFKEIKKNDIINENAIELFGDIVEFN